MVTAKIKNSGNTVTGGTETFFGLSGEFKYLIEAFEVLGFSFKVIVPPPL
jgi:hypothetical protein